MPPTEDGAARIAFVLNGTEVSVVDDGTTLLDALREQLGCRSPKDGCSPQGQCGCCTVLVDGAPRVSCVTPARRVAGRSITTTEGLSPEQQQRWADAFVRAGASQCGFCTPGLVMRLASLESRGSVVDAATVCTSLLAHLCRCTGWQTVVEAALDALDRAPGAEFSGDAPSSEVQPNQSRDLLLSAWRAQLEGPIFQSSGRDVVLGAAGFACDTAPPEALTAVLGAEGSYQVSATLAEARQGSGKVQGRRSTIGLGHPLALPDGEWDLTLQTTWVEPSYLEPDASWARPGELPASPLANGGAFGGKRRSPTPDEARELADRLGQPARVLWSREDVVRRGQKRPPLAAALRLDGSGIVRVGTSGPASLAPVTELLSGQLPNAVAEVVALRGPPTSGDLRGAGWVEGAVLAEALRSLRDGRVPEAPGIGRAEVTAPGGGRAQVTVDGAPGGAVEVDVWAGEILDAVTLRSYCIGAVHQGLGWVWSEGIAVDKDGQVRDLTIRSFGILSARETPPITVRLHTDDRTPTNGSDAVFAAAAAAAWIAEGLPPQWPTRRGRPSSNKMVRPVRPTEEVPA